MSSNTPPSSPRYTDRFNCEICHIKFYTLLSIKIHCRGKKHKQQMKCLGLSLPNKKTTKKIECLEDFFYAPDRNVALIGLQYVIESNIRLNKRFYSCRLCNLVEVWMQNMLYNHLVGLKHRTAYITKHFPFLFENAELSLEFVEKIAEAVEEAEGLKAYTTDIPSKRPRLPLASTPSDCSSREDVIGRILEKLAKSGMHFEDPRKNTSTLSPGLSPPGFVHNICSKPLKISTVGTCKQASAMQSLDHQQPQFSLSCASPVPSSFASSSVNISLGSQTLKQGFFSPTELQHAGNLSQVNGDYVCENSGLVQECIPSEYGSLPSTLPPDYGSFPSTLPPDYGSFPSTLPSDYGSFPYTVPRGCPYQYLNNGGGYAYQMFHGYIQTVPDVTRSAYTAEGKNLRQESAPTDVKDLLSMGTIGHSSSSLNCPSGNSTSNDYSDGSSSYYSCGSVNNHILPSKPALPSRKASVLHEESSCPKSSGDTPLSRVSPSSTINSCVPSSQTIDSGTTETKPSELSPDILKILKGKDVPTVNSIMNRLAEYYPPLQNVDISLLVDVLFETGAID